MSAASAPTTQAMEWRVKSHRSIIVDPVSSPHSYIVLGLTSERGRALNGARVRVVHSPELKALAISSDPLGDFRVPCTRIDGVEGSFRVRPQNLLVDDWRYSPQPSLPSLSPKQVTLCARTAVLNLEDMGEPPNEGVAARTALLQAIGQGDPSWTTRALRCGDYCFGHTEESCPALELRTMRLQAQLRVPCYGDGTVDFRRFAHGMSPSFEGEGAMRQLVFRFLQFAELCLCERCIVALMEQPESEQVEEEDEGDSSDDDDAQPAGNVVMDGLSAVHDEYPDVLTPSHPWITQEEVLRVLRAEEELRDEVEPEKAERKARAVRRMLFRVERVLDRLWLPQGLEGLSAQQRQNHDYLSNTFERNPRRIVWWLRNVCACGAPDDGDRRTGSPVHLLECTDKQIAAWVRTGWSPRAGPLPAELKRTLPPREAGY